METDGEAVLLVNEMMSPERGRFDKHVEQAYRRRDVTVMTMHNAKQRTEEEWRGVIWKASERFVVSVFSFIYLQSARCTRGI